MADADLNTANVASPASKTSCRVYVGNLAWRARWQDLKDHMRSVGEVKYVEIIEELNGRSKGCGVVEYVDPEAAEKAIKELHDTLLFDRKIFVREDREARDSATGEGRPWRPRQRPRRPGLYSNGNEKTAGRQLYVGNLPWRTTWTDLKDLFGGSEMVERADVACEQNGRSRGYGLVIMKSKEAAEDAIGKPWAHQGGGTRFSEKFSSYEISGRPLVVKMDEGPPRRLENRA